MANRGGWPTGEGGQQGRVANRGGWPTGEGGQQGRVANRGGWPTGEGIRSDNKIPVHLVPHCSTPSTHCPQNGAEWGENISIKLKNNRSKLEHNLPRPISERRNSPYAHDLL